MTTHRAFSSLVLPALAGDRQVEDYSGTMAGQQYSCDPIK